MSKGMGLGSIITGLVGLDKKGKIAQRKDRDVKLQVVLISYG